MSGSSGGSSGSGLGTLFILMLGIGLVALFLFTPGGPRGVWRDAENKASEITSSSRVITACEKSSKNGVYTITDADGTRYSIAETVRRSQKKLTAKEAYDVFRENRAFRVRVSLKSLVIGDRTQITWIESASKKLKPEEC